jgi:hypothetical protein
MKFINKMMLAFMALVALASCEKKTIDLTPIDVVPAEKAITTMNDLTAAVNGVYATWQPKRPIYISALISDEAQLGTGSGYRNVGNILFNWAHVSDSQDWRDVESGGVYTNMYSVIDRANRVLSYLPNVTTPAPADVALAQQYKGEMLALRGLAHLELLRNYSATADFQPGALGVVVMNEYARNPASFRPVRNTQGEVMAQIEADLAAARDLIPATATAISHITRNGAIAGQARAALYAKKWQIVVDRATEVINAQPLTARASFTSIWTTRTLADNQGTEVIWKLNMGASDVTNSKVIGSQFQDNNGAVQARPSNKLLSTYDQVNDIRWTAYYATVGGLKLLSKYGVVNANSENFLYDAKMIRTAELVLARAEAYTELGQLTNANNDLKMLRQARITGYVHTDITVPATMISEILLERFRELSFEGHRYYDLKRRVLPIQRDLTDVVGNTAIQTLNPSESKYILPIPYQETQAAPSVAQNSGY